MKDINFIIKITNQLRETNQRNGKLSKKSLRDIHKILDLWNDIAEREGNLNIREHPAYMEIVKFIAEISKAFTTQYLLNESGKNDQKPP